MRLSQSALFVALAAAGLLPSFAIAQTSTAPATQASTTQPARRALVMPPGFGRVESHGITVLCESADAKWVAEALTAYTPTTRPATMPADLLARIPSQRKTLSDMMVKDLGLKDRVGLDQLFDQTILPELRHLDSFRPPVFYLVTTKPLLKDLIRTEKWSDPRFYYNRLADEVMFTTAVPLSLDKPMDDTVVPALYEADWDATHRGTHLVQTLQAADIELQRTISGRAQFHCHTSLIAFMMKSVFEPMDLKPGQRWFALGSSGVLSSDYAHELTGADRHELLAMLVVEIRRSPVPTAAIDLLHPLDASSIRRQYLNAYSDAFRRKSVFVARKWLDKSGHESFTRVLEAIRKTPPADGEGLLNLIKTDSGIDLSDDAQAR